MKNPLTILAELEIPLLIIGGVAVQIYGYNRFTRDFDFVIAFESGPALAQKLQAAGFQESEKNNLVVRYHHVDDPQLIFDALLVDQSTFQKLWTARREKQIGTVRLNLAAPLHVAVMKLHALKQDGARLMQDLPDIVELLRRDAGNWTEEELRSACDRYGPPGIYETLRPHLQP